MSDNPHNSWCGLCNWHSPDRATEWETIRDAVSHYTNNHPDKSDGITDAWDQYRNYHKINA